MSDDLCPHGEPIATARSTCIDCMAAPPPPPEKPHLVGPSFAAQYASACVGEPACGGIEPGDEIAACSDGVYRHPGCMRYAR